MTNQYQEYNKHFEPGEYLPFDEIDFSIIINEIKKLPFFMDDTCLGMQAINVGIVDNVIAQYEKLLLDYYWRDDDTVNLVLTIFAYHQNWCLSGLPDFYLGYKQPFYRL